MTQDTANARAAASEARAAEYAFDAAIAQNRRDWNAANYLARQAAFARRNARAFRALATGSALPA